MKVREHRRGLRKGTVRIPIGLAILRKAERTPTEYPAAIRLASSLSYAKGHYVTKNASADP